MGRGNTRRDKGDGAIFQRKSDGMWIARYKPEGSAKIKYLAAKTRPTVVKKLKEYKTKMSKYSSIEIVKISVQEYMEKWFYEVKMNELKPKSLDALDCTLHHQVYPHIGEIQLGALTTDDIQAMLNNLVKEGLAYSTIKKAYDAVNSCIKLSIIKDDLIKNPCLGASLPKNIKKKKSDIRFFTQDEIDRICEEAVSQHSNKKPVYRLGHAIIVLLYTGMRIGELHGLKWKDINFVKKTAKLIDSVVLVKDRNRDEDDASTPKYKLIEQDSAKTDSSERLVPLNKKAIAALKEIHKLNAKFDHVMSTSTGKIVIPRNVDRMLRSILERCHIKPSGVHALRHSFASMLFKNGVDVKTVSELLGHSDVSVTYNTYIHLIQEQKHTAVDILDDL
jgi:integrase